MRIRALTGPIVLAALFATTPQLAVGLDRGDEPSVKITCSACRPGTEIKSDQLMEFLAKNVNVRFLTGKIPLYVKLQLKMISPEEGVIGKWESEPVEIAAGKTYPALRRRYRRPSCPRFNWPWAGSPRPLPIS